VVEAHRVAGDTLWLLTGSSPYLSRRAAEAFGLHGYSCNVFLTEGPRFTGEVATPLCYGRGKIHHAEQVAAERGLRLADCIFYTDSYSDAPAMEAFGEAVAVNPDPRLAALARRRGWRVERWGRG
jgi:phosphoserine phosphatase